MTSRCLINNEAVVRPGLIATTMDSMEDFDDVSALYSDEPWIQLVANSKYGATRSGYGARSAI